MNDQVRVSTSASWHMAAILVVILVIIHWTKPTVDLGKEFDGIKVTAHTWAIFFPKNRFFSFFDIL